MQILSVSAMQAVEKAADEAGHTYARMMELAGQGVARAMLRRVPLKGRRVLILVGPGNNGGDGLVAARYLKDAGARVTAYLSRPREPEEDAVFKQALEREVELLTYEEDEELGALEQQLAKCHILVDALLGTGATPPLRGNIEEILRTADRVLSTTNHDPLTVLNRVPECPAARPYVVAVDGPSGMDFDTGEIDPLTLKAHLTITFANPKWGHLRFPAAEHVGELLVADIGIPEGVEIPQEEVELATPEMVRAWLPRRSDDSHKGTFGKALIVAGSMNYTGAAALTATAAVRAGAGLVTLAIAGALHHAIVPLVPEATYLLLPNVLGAVTADALQLLKSRLADYDALLVGPGLGQAEETVAFIRALFGLAPKRRPTGFLKDEGAASQARKPELPPLVIDADGLNILSKQDDWPSLLPPGSVLTPHPGEMARLTGLEVGAIEQERWATTRKYAQEWGQVVVLKGAFTVVAAPEGQTVLLPFANGGLASAGTGDVLAGAITALRAQGLGAFEAAVSGVYLHGLAGELVRVEVGKTGMAARDVAVALPRAIARLQGR
jgi:NAD(P)H-hydrate epimerase